MGDWYDGTATIGYAAEDLAAMFGVSADEVREAFATGDPEALRRFGLASEQDAAALLSRFEVY
jgi:hypothetical protein